MPIIIDPNIKTIFIVPPKNGCSTARIEIGKVMFPEKVGNKKITDNRYFDKDFNKINNKYRNNEKLSDFKIIVIYRNIYDRFLSFCNVLYERVTRDIEYGKAWDNYLYVYEKNNIKLSLNTEINDIIKIQQYVNELKTRTLIDIHGLTQKNRIESHFNRFRFLNMNKIEFHNINDMSDLLKKLYKIEPIKYNSSHNIKNSKNLIYLKDLKTFDKKYISNELKEKLNTLYKDDIDFFKSYNINITN